MSLRVTSEQIGEMGTGSNFFRCGLVHSSGVIYLGTYGPQPAIIWKYDPGTGRLEEVGRPGEYQLDCMVEAPNGTVYIGTAYSALVYRLDPDTDRVTSIGTPPVESTSWIFTMVRTTRGEIYGSKGVGLFRLDWENDRFEGIGPVPGDHATPGPNASEPIVRRLEEAPDGTLWGDTNRWLFRFDPDSSEIEPLVDMVSVDDSCYGLFLPYGPEPTRDCHFAIFSRFSDQDVGTPFYAYRIESRQIEPLAIEGWAGSVAGHPEWWRSGDATRLLVPTWSDDDERITVSVVDPFDLVLLDRWEVQGNPTTAGLLPGGGFYFSTAMTGGLMVADAGRLEMVVENPVPVECRCLAASPCRILEADTNDCGHVFSLDPGSGTRRDHGKVWREDHRCNYGPAAFAGEDGRYFLENHSQGLPALWVTDTATDRHWRAGEPAVQLERFGDGTVWGAVGPNPTTMAFEPGRSWVPSWQARRGVLFRYRPGERQAEALERFPEVWPLTEAPAGGGQILMACGSTLVAYDPERREVVAEVDLCGEQGALSRDGSRSTAYLLLGDGTLWSVGQVKDGPGLTLTVMTEGFGPHERGFFVLPRSGRVIAIAASGAVTVYEPGPDALRRVDGPVPLPSGSAVDPASDAWFFADR